MFLCICWNFGKADDDINKLYFCKATLTYLLIRLFLCEPEPALEASTSQARNPIYVFIFANYIYIYIFDLIIFFQINFFIFFFMFNLKYISETSFFVYKICTKIPQSQLHNIDSEPF